MRALKFTLLLAFILSFQNILAQTTYYVSLSGSNSPPYSSIATGANDIQTAVDAASSGDLILINDGTYVLTTNISVTKGITIRSINGNSYVTVDGNNVTRCFFINHTDAVIDGLSITNGYNPNIVDSGFGGGANIYDGGTIQNCVITNCQARDGAGVAIQNDGLVINSVLANNNADNNSSSGYGGGVRMLNGGTTRGCLIHSNTSANYGGGINIWNAGTIQRCTITNNAAPNGAGVRARNNSLMENTISYFNNGLDVQLSGVGYLFNYNCTTNSHLLPGIGNTSADPMLGQAGSLNPFLLNSASTLINAGLNQAWMTGAIDLDANNRIISGTVDIGAYEYAGNTIISDDFSPETTLDTSIWEFIDPLNDATLTLSGTNAKIDITQGISHDLAGNLAPRLLQTIDDIDFGVEVKFESIPNTQYQMQGIVVQTSTNARIRFETYAAPAPTFYVNSYGVAFPISAVNQAIGGAIPQYLRVIRSDDDWTFQYSYTGLAGSWTNITNFTLAVNVNKVGFYGANHNPNPGFTVNADYFINLANPIIDTDTQAPEPPVIDVWYGTTQNFGQLGNPQNWINILGRVTDDISVSSLTYKLNGGSSIPLAIGPNGTRLVGSGDFNIEIDRSTLINGANTVEITATDGDAASTTETVTLNYNAGNIWPLPHTVDWSSIADIEDIDQVAEVADGLWELVPGGIKTVQTGYDRLVVVGDQTWTTNYEVEVPIIIHANQNDAGIGFAVGWQGHTGSVSPRTQWPLQAIGWVRYQSGSPNLRILTYTTGIEASQPISITNGTIYRLKARSEAIGGGQSRFYVKIWEDGTAEPVTWMIQADVASRDGSVLMITHKADVTWGNMIITPVVGNSSPAFTSSPVTSGEEGQVFTYNITASDPNVDDVLTITCPTKPNWLTFTDNGNGTALLTGTPAVSDVGANAVELVVQDPALLQDQQAFNIFVTPAGQTIPISDDYYPETTAQNFWRFLDPVGDCAYSLTGTNLLINIAGGTSHDSWSSGVNAARLLQLAPQGDFGVEVKFDSAPSERYQMQGIVVQEDDDTIMRFEVFHDGSTIRIFAAYVDAGSGTANAYINIVPNPVTVPSYLHVDRSGNGWTFSYSFDNVAWITAGSFTQTLNVTEVGVYGGNHIPNPAFTVDVDYFMNTAHPIPDDVSETPDVPTLASPVDQSTGVSLDATLSWNASAGADTYTIAIATDDSFTDIVYSNSGITGTSTIVSGLSNDTQYYWHVSAKNGGGSSGFSDYFEFTTVSANVPIITWPTNGVLVYTNSQWLYWYPSSYQGNIVYDVLYSTNASMTNSTIIENITLTNYNLSGLIGDTTYYWQVRLKTTSGIVISYSEIESFKTIPFATGPTIPILSWPIGGATVYTTSPTLFWYLGTAQTGLIYEVEYSTGALIGSPNITNITTTYVKLPVLTNGTTFIWQVRSFDGTEYSDWSVQESFQTVSSPAPLVPIPSWPIGGAVVYTVSPTLYWFLNGPSAGLTFEVELSNGALTGSPTIIGLESTNVPLSDLNGSTTYNWQVRSTDGVTYSDWSVQQSFTTYAVVPEPVTPVPSWPIGGALIYTDSPILYWYLGADGTGLTYEIEHSTGPLVGSPTVTGITNLFTALSGLTPSTIYNWHVRSFDGTDFSEWSVQESFGTVGGLGGPTVPYPSWPLGGVTVYTNSPTLNWYLGTSATGITYDVRYSTDPEMNGAVAIPNINDLNITLSGLSNGVTYYWQVRATDGIVYSAYCSAQSFTVSSNNLSVVPLPGSPTGGVTIEANIATLSWILPTASEKLTYELEYSTSPEMLGAANLFVESSSEKISGLMDGKTYYWRIRSRAVEGEISAFSNIEKFNVSTITSTEEIEAKIPSEYELNQNFPNPFNPSTTISFGLPEAGYYTLIVYNIIGQEVAALVSEFRNAGTYSVVFDAGKLASGLYFYMLTGENVRLTRKMMLIK